MPANRQVDIDLAVAIRAQDAVKVKELINKQGANPFAVLYSNTGNPTFILIEAVGCGNAGVVKEILDHALKVRTSSYEPIDLAKQYVMPKCQMNLFQYAVLHGNSATLIALYEYAKETNQDKNMSQILRSNVIHDAIGGAKYSRDLGSELVRTMSIDSIRNFAFPKDGSASSIYALGDFLREWFYCKDESKFINAPKMEIIWKGPLGNLEFLLSKGLDAEPVLSMVSKMLRWSKSPTDWSEFLKLLAIPRAEIEPERYETEDGKPYFYMTTTNRFGKCPVKFKIVLDLEPMYNKVNRYVTEARSNNPALAGFKKDMDAMKAKVDGLSERLHEDARDSLKDNPNALHCFNKIQDAIHTYLLANKIASTGKFAIKSTDKSAMIVKSVVTILNMTSQAAGPFGGIVAGVAGACIQEVEQYQVKKHTRTVATSTLGIDINKLSIQLAALITYRAMQSYGDDIKERAVDSFIATIKAEIVNANQFENQAELTAYLFQEATDFLPEVKERHSSDHSHPSTSTGSGKDSPKAMVVSFDRFKKASGGSDEALGVVAIQDAIPVKRTGLMRFICA